METFRRVQAGYLEWVPGLDRTGVIVAINTDSSAESEAKIGGMGRAQGYSKLRKRAVDGAEAGVLAGTWDGFDSAVPFSPLPAVPNPFVKPRQVWFLEQEQTERTEELRGGESASRP